MNGIAFFAPYFLLKGGQKAMVNGADRIFQQQKKSMAEQLWLCYFNAILHEKGLITESQRNRIYNMIRTRNMSVDRIKKQNRG